MSTEENAPFLTPFDNTAFRQANAKRNKQIRRVERRRALVGMILATTILVVTITAVWYIAQLLISSRNVLANTADVPPPLIAVMAVIGGLMIVGSLALTTRLVINGVRFFSKVTGIGLVSLRSIALVSISALMISAAITVTYLALVFYR